MFFAGTESENKYLKFETKNIGNNGLSKKEYVDHNLLLIPIFGDYSTSVHTDLSASISLILTNALYYILNQFSIDGQFSYLKSS